MATDLNTIRKLEVPVIVLVGEHRVPMDDILALTPGAILELDNLTSPIWPWPSYAAEPLVYQYYARPRGFISFQPDRVAEAGRL